MTTTDVAIGSTTAKTLQRSFDTQQEAFRSAPYPSLAVRRDRLLRLEHMNRRHSDAIVQAIRQDYGHRSAVETHLAEVAPLALAIRHTRRNLKRWMRPERARPNWRFLPARAWIHRQPLGVIGIMSPWNFPWNLAMLPALDALAAGNRVMLKPSEMAPATSKLIAELVERYFSAEEFSVINGGPETAHAFAGLPFDHLFFTGSTSVGRQVAQAAAANLTPITLELGGKSPAVIADDADLDEAAQRIAYGKWFNAGQACISPDYVLIAEHRLHGFIEAMQRATKRLYPHPANNEDYTAIITRRHRQRLIELRDEAENHGCRIVELGASVEQLEASGKFPPTLIINPHGTLRVMQEEIFGPILPIIGIKDLDAAIAYINRYPHPLALYGFTHDATSREKLLTRTQSGGVTINDTLWHAAQETLPFGGIGHSGSGAYHGERGFLTFSHERSVFEQSKRSAVSMIYPPYRRWLLKILRLI